MQIGRVFCPLSLKFQGLRASPRGPIVDGAAAYHRGPLRAGRTLNPCIRTSVTLGGAPPLVV